MPQFNLTNVPTLALRQQAPAGMQPILNGFPLPNGKDLGNGLAEFRASYSDPSSLDATSIRIDHSINSRLTLFGRYNKAPSQSTARQQDINLSRLQISRLDAQTLTVGATASLTSRISNELRVNYSDAGAFSALPMDNFGGATPPPLTALVPSQYGSGAPTGSVTLNLPGRTSLSLPSVSINPSRAANQRQFNIVNNLSYSAGSHQFKFGFDWRRLTPTIAINTYLLTTTFSSLQQIQNAIAPSGTILASAAMKPLFVNISAYGQDTWRVSQRLTLDLGVRWDVNPAPSEANGKVPVAVTEIDNLATMQLASLGTKEWKTGYENFAPRLGFAYQLFRTPGRETVLRGGFGVFHDTGNDVALDNFNQKFPYASSRSVSNVVYPLSATQVAPGALPIQAGLTTPYPTFFAFDPNLKLPYTLQWNIAIEQSLGKSQAITASYVGAAGRNLLQSKQLTLTTINPKFTTITLTTNSATSDYDALQVQFQRRLSRGLQALASYTWSHALDDDSSGSTARVAQHGNAAFDVRQVFAAAATYDVPSPHNNRFARVVLGSWSLDTSVHAQSALPVDLVARTQTDPITGGLVNVRPNVNPGVPFYVSDPTVPGGRKINSAAFSVPATGQSGNFGRNQLRGFGGWQFDSALRRRFKLTERLSLQFRAEAFNLFNHPNFGTIQTSLTATNFGQATNMLNRQLGGISQLYQIGGPRSFQFAMKLLF